MGPADAAPDGDSAPLDANLRMDSADDASLDGRPDGSRMDAMPDAPTDGELEGSADAMLFSCEGQAAGLVCRPARAPCDRPEICDGVSATCPPDTATPEGVACRPAVGDCDVPELCDGTSLLCPADQFAPAGANCPAGMCSGASPACL